jgi:NTE family protein
VGIRPDFLVGTSAGAINAAFLGGGFTAERVARLEELWRSVKTRDVFPGLGMVHAARTLLGSGTLASAKGLDGILARHLPPAHDDLALPAFVVATDLATGTPVVLGDGDLRQNVLASAAIPGVFPPVTIEEQVLVDGGIVAQVPLVQAQELGAATMVVFDVGFP